MKQEDNVYETTPSTEGENEKKASVETKVSGSQSDSAVLGKFKDVNALARAYEALEAEFTRRSQRLRELEKKAENFAQSGEFGVEKLRKNAEARKIEEKRFDDFVAEVDQGKVKEIEKKEAEPALEENTLEENKSDLDLKQETEGVSGTEQTALSVENNASETGERETKENAVKKDDFVALANESSSVADKDGATISSKQAYDSVMQDEALRLRIIGEYLASLGKSGAPLTATGGGSLATPPLKARNISDAGVMALRYFKKGAEIE